MLNDDNMYDMIILFQLSPLKKGRAPSPRHGTLELDGENN